MQKERIKKKIREKQFQGNRRKHGCGGWRYGSAGHGLRVVAAVPEDLALIPNICIVSHSQPSVTQYQNI